MPAKQDIPTKGTGLNPGVAEPHGDQELPEIPNE